MHDQAAKPQPIIMMEEVTPKGKDHPGRDIQRKLGRTTSTGP